MIVDSLPQGWAIAITSEAIETNGIIADGDWIESKDQDPNGDVRLIQLADIGDGYFKNKSERFMTCENAERMNCTFLETGDLLIARMPDPLGRACIFPGVGQKAVTVVDICLIRPSTGSALQSKLLMYWINTPQVRNFIALQATGTTRKRITRKKLEALELPIPPLAEQQQIAAKLDELLAQVDTLKTRLDTIPKILKRFRQSVLAAAVSGKLSEDWREANKPSCTDSKNITEILFDNGITAGNFGKKSDKAPVIQEDETRLVLQNECNWPIVRIGAICGCIVPNRDKPKTFSGGYHWLLTPHFEDQSIRIDYTKIENGLSEEEVAEYRAKVIAENSVVMTCVGRVGLSAVLSQKAVINQQLHAFIPNEYILADFLAYAIRANVKYYEDKATSTTVSYLNKTACNSLPIPLPSIEEQTEVVQRVEQLFTYADQIEQRVKDAQARINHLAQAILAKAFRGELTAEWREQNPELSSGENSAAALLARIKAERQELVTNKVTNRRIIKKPSENMKPKGILPIIEALKAADQPLSSQDLLVQSGYPGDASTEQLEAFFLDIRAQLNAKAITRNRQGDQEFFAIAE